MAVIQRTPLIAGNWKMNGLRASGAALVAGLVDRLAAAGGVGCDILVCPPATLLEQTRAAIAGSPLLLGAQDCHPDAAGAHTGDVSAEMLADVGCSYVIVGHSERRADHGEDDALVRAKAAAAVRAGLIPIVCVGETLADREAGRAEAVVTAQIAGSIPPGSAGGRLVVAYEPVWAIGTGRTPTAADIAAMHAVIRARLGDAAEDSAAVRILYGGSVKPDNALEILGIREVDGALVGGASLDAEDFWTIVGNCP